MDWEILEHKTLFQRFFRLDEYRLKYQTFGGDHYTVVREVFERGDAVAVLPYDPVRDEIVLIEQFRVGAIRTQQQPWLLELIAGVIEPGETPAAVAQREAMEEAGCKISELHLIHRYLVSPGGSTEQVSLYIAKTSTEHMGGIYGLAEEQEDIKVHIVSREQAIALLEQQRIANGVTIIGLQWLALNHQQLQAQWQG